VWRGGPKIRIEAVALTLLAVWLSGLAPVAAAPEPLYLHTSGSSNVLNAVPPTAAAEQSKRSAAVVRTAYKLVGSWSAAPIPGAAVAFGEFGDLHVWLGLVNSDDQGTNFDLRAELVKNGASAPIATGELKDIRGVTRDPNRALEVTVAFPAVSPVRFDPGDVLTLNLYTKVTDRGGHNGAIGLVVYYDSTRRPARFAATRTPIPIANAGPDVNALIGWSAVLDGSESFDPGAGRITFRWALVTAPSGSAATLRLPGDPKPAFVPDIPGDYVFELVVNNGAIDSSADRVTLHAFDTDSPKPNARAGRDQTAAVNAVVTLDGSESYAPDRAALGFAWRFVSVPTGSGRTDADISTRTTAQAQFRPDAPGIYVLALTVTAGALTDEDSVQVVAGLPNVPPIADAGPDELAPSGAVTLDGRDSVDPDHGPAPLGYQWRLVSQPSGSALTTASLGSATTATPTFTPDVLGPYVFRLTVTDGTASASDNVLVRVDNSAPLAVAFRSPATTGFLRGTVSVEAQATGGVDSVRTFTLDVDGKRLSATVSLPAASATASASWNTAGVSDGPHTLRAGTSDGVGTIATATRIVTVDNTPPDTSITSSPSQHSDSSTAVFEFTGSDDLTPTSQLQFAWSLDGGTFSAFASSTSVTVTGLDVGFHNFDVKSRDLAGNEDTSTASVNFTVCTAPFIEQKSEGFATGDPPRITSGFIEVNGCGFGSDPTVSVTGAPVGSQVTTSSSTERVHVDIKADDLAGATVVLTITTPSGSVSDTVHFPIPVPHP
jgi:hypothetical protein